MDDAYFEEQSRRVRALADKADPFTKKRLLALAESYEQRIGRPSRAVRQLPRVEINGERPENRQSDDKAVH